MPLVPVLGTKGNDYAGSADPAEERLYRIELVNAYALTNKDETPAPSWPARTSRRRSRSLRPGRR